MAQPTLDGLILNDGTGTSRLAGDLITCATTSKFAQIVLMAYSTGDTTLSVVQQDVPLPVSAVQSGTWNVGTLTTITNPVVVNGGAGQTSDVKITLDSEKVAVTSLPALVAGTALIGKVSIDQVTANANEVVIKSITAGDANIGNVDIVTLPAGNLGQRAMVSSLSVVIANNITDATYIGDIKFGESLPAGTNAIGKLAANSGVDIGDVDVTSQPARDRLTDNMGVALQTDALLNDTTLCTPTFLAISANSTTNQLVAGESGKKTRVLSMFLYGAGSAVTAYLQSGTTAILGSSAASIMLDKTGATGPAGFCLPFSPVGWCETAVSTHLNLHLSAAQYVGGSLVYVKV